MSKIKKMQVRVLFQNTLYELLLDGTNRHCVPVYPPYRPSKPICTQDEDEIFFWGLIPHIKQMEPLQRLHARKRFFDDLFAVYSNISEVCEKNEDITFECLMQKEADKKGERNKKRSALMDRLKKLNDENKEREQSSEEDYRSQNETPAIDSPPVVETPPEATQNYLQMATSYAQSNIKF